MDHDELRPSLFRQGLGALFLDRIALLRFFSVTDGALHRLLGCVGSGHLSFGSATHATSGERRRLKRENPSAAEKPVSHDFDDDHPMHLPKTAGNRASHNVEAHRDAATRENDARKSNRHWY